MSPKKVETLSSKRSVRAMLAGNLDGGSLDGENEGKAKVHQSQ